MIDSVATILRRIGDTLLDLRGRGVERGEWHGTQLKTEADMLAHRLIAEGLVELDLGVPVISEEDAKGQTAARPDRYWLIDPIDGTASYAAGFDGWVTQAALMESGIPVLGAVYAPAFGDMFLAERGRGARLNGRPLDVNDTRVVNTLIDNYPEPRGTAKAVVDALGLAGYVEQGSIGLKACRIADGTANLFFKDVVLRDWDVAPAHLVVGEAGGYMVQLDGSPYIFDGPYEKSGIIVAGGRETLTRIVQFFETEERREK